MDIDLLSKMVGDLILDNDEVALPGVGTFVAEFVGATFSDKGFVINPPYRRLSFRQREGDASLLVDFYARTNSLDKATAADILTRFLSEMKEVLKTKKYIIFPGLGRLRATRENLFFFVPDEDLNIYPEGFGLEPVSLKSHEELEEISGLAETVEALAELSGPGTEQAVSVLEAAKKAPSDTEPAVSVPEADGMVSAPADKTAVEAPVLDPVDPEVEAPVMNPAGLASPAEPVEPAEPADPASPAEHAEPAEPAVHYHRRRRRPKMSLWMKELLILLGIALGLLLLLFILGRVAPEFVDRFLYTREELEILYK